MFFILTVAHIPGVQSLPAGQASPARVPEENGRAAHGKFPETLPTPNAECGRGEEATWRFLKERQGHPLTYTHKHTLLPKYERQACTNPCPDFEATMVQTGIQLESGWKRLQALGHVSSPPWAEPVVVSLTAAGVHPAKVTSLPGLMATGLQLVLLSKQDTLQQPNPRSEVYLTQTPLSP